MTNFYGLPDDQAAELAADLEKYQKLSKASFPSPSEVLTVSNRIFEKLAAAIGVPM